MTSSGKVRIYELSKDLGLDNKDVLDAAEKLSKEAAVLAWDEKLSKVAAVIVAWDELSKSAVRGGGEAAVGAL